RARPAGAAAAGRARARGAAHCRLQIADASEPPAAGADGPRLAELLALAAENRRLRAAVGEGRLEGELDVLHRALAEQRGREEERLRTQKLQALAEFAAGAGHEINNPLAVISGQAQYLLGHEAA